MGRGERVLVGVDVSLAYAEPFPQAALGDGAGWFDVWALVAGLVHDDEGNVNDRFAAAAVLNRMVGAPEGGPFWGRPRRMDLADLPAHRRHRFPLATRAGSLPERRLAETVPSPAGRLPSTSWQLLGAGSVGGQVLTALPVLHALRTDPDLAPVLRVWPFETGDAAGPGTGPAIWVGEVWPTRFVSSTSPWSCRDEAQVAGTAEALGALDRSGRLALGAVARSPAAARLRREGWMLGAPPP
jgi:hypothetical protein